MDFISAIKRCRKDGSMQRKSWPKSLYIVRYEGEDDDIYRFCVEKGLGVTNGQLWVMQLSRTDYLADDWVVYKPL